MSRTEMAAEASNDQDENVGGREDLTVLLGELSDSVESYCRRRPGVVAGVLFGLGFFCGWKLRPW
jgi:hypothetical protein